MAAAKHARTLGIPNTPLNQIIVAAVCGYGLLILYTCVSITNTRDEARAQRENQVVAQATAIKKAQAEHQAAQVEAAKTPEQRAKEAKGRAIRKETERKAIIAQASAPITVSLEFPDNLTTGLSMVSLTQKVFDQLKGLQASGRLDQAPSITFVVNATMEDRFGNKSHDRLMSLMFSSIDLRQINWDNMNNWKVMEFCAPTSYSGQAREILVKYGQDSTTRTFAPSFLARAVRS